MQIRYQLFLVIAVMAIAHHAQAYPGEGITRNSATGNYTITYRGNPNGAELSQTVFVPATKIDPIVRSSVRLGERGVVIYRYSVSNGAAAQQDIVSVVLEQIVNPVLGEIPFPSVFQNVTQVQLDAYNVAEVAALTSPVGWDGDISRRISNIGWSPQTANFKTDGIHVGRMLSGFGFSSLDLPGVSQSKLAGLVGDSEIFGFPDDGPLKDSSIFMELKKLRKNNYVVRNAAVPTIAVPVPFDAAVLLDRIRTHVATWTGKQLLDPAFAAQLDRYMVAAAESFRRNQLKAAKEHLETIHELIEKEHKHLDGEEDEMSEKDEHKPIARPNIDRLAARVLDFDLKYVLKRMERDEDEHKKR